MKENDSTKKMDPVVHFEFPGKDTNRMCNFYSKAFGWRTRQMGDENGNYVLVTAAEADEAGHPKEKGRINGGFYPRDDKMPGQYPSVVIAVDDIQQSMKKIKDAGGEVLGDPMPIPGYGLYVSFFDTEGNRVALMQPTM